MTITPSLPSKPSISTSVQGLLALVMSAAEAGATMAAHRIDLVDKDDTGRVFFSLIEHVAYPRGTDTDKHFDEIGARNGEEGDLGFAGDSLGQQGFTGTGRAHHQDAPRNLATQLLELGGIAQELDQFGHFFLGFVDARDVVERDIDLVFAQQACLALAERHRATSAAATLHLAHEEYPQADQHDEREPADKHMTQQRRRLRGFAEDRDIGAFEVADQGAVVGFRAIGRERRAGNHLAGDILPFDGHFPDLALFHLGQKIRIYQGLRAGAAITETVEYRQ
jgi:hypothetical protein